MTENTMFVVAVDNDEKIFYDVFNFLDDRSDIMGDPQFALDSFVEAWNDELAEDGSGEITSATLFKFNLDANEKVALATY